MYENWDAGVKRLLNVIKPIPLNVQNLMRSRSLQNTEIRISAINALGEIGPKATPAKPLMIRALEDKDWYVRKSAVEALGKIGPEAAPAVPTLIMVFRKEDKDVRVSAEKALKKLVP
jgi:HEAT repeat protein